MIDQLLDSGMKPGLIVFLLRLSRAHPQGASWSEFVQVAGSKSNASRRIKDAGKWLHKDDGLWLVQPPLEGMT